MLGRGVVVALTWPILLGGVAACGGSDDDVAASTSTVPEADEAWDLVYLQDSRGFGVADLYAEHVTEELGVEVDVHDRTANSLAAITIREQLRREEPPSLIRVVRDAEIIVIFGGPQGSGSTADFEICMSTSTEPREPPAHYSAEDNRPYRDVLDEIFTEIWRLRDGEPVVLRAVDFVNPTISAWREAGIEPECTAALEAFSDTIRETAETNGATFVSLYDVFNGIDHQEDATVKGYISADGIHTSAEGAAAIADALAAAGFELNEPGTG